MDVLFQALSFGMSLLNSITHPYDVMQSRKLIQERVASRVSNFLSLCKSQIYERSNNPYRKLLLFAGYDGEVLRDLVFSLGLEASLSRLASDGVYIDIEEFKGKKPVIRNGLSFQFSASDVDMVSGPSVPMQSSGSSGSRMRSPIDIEGIRLLSSCIPLIVESLDAQVLPAILYYPMPSTPGIIHLITFAMGGKTPTAWFSQVPLRSLRKSASGRQLAALIMVARARGVNLPFPKSADIRHPVHLARWICEKCPDGALVATFPGSALRLIQSAQREKLKLPSLAFILGGEPITARKRKILEEKGHRVFPWFSTVEAGRISLGCLNPSEPDGMHLMEDQYAAISHSRVVDTAGNQRKPLLFTSLLPSSYKLLFNVETGDEGALTDADCGCYWEKLGLKRHLHSIQSFEKLTMEGMTYVADMLSDLVDDVFPNRFGGTPADYQFIEEEDDDGLTRLIVSVSPEIAADNDIIYSAVMEALQHAAPIQTPMTELLERATSVVVRREHPRLTASGKILTLQRQKRNHRAGS